MIRRQHKQQRILAQCHSLHRCEGDCGRRVASVGFEEQLRPNVDLTELLGDNESMLFAANDYRLPDSIEAFQAFERILKQRAIHARDLDVLLGQQRS
jgi:hypothetical protein